MDEFFGSLIGDFGLTDSSGENIQTLGFTDFLLSINWKEPWLMLLMVSHILMLILIILCRNKITLQILLLMSMLGVVLLSERINKLAAENYRLFADDQYFDEKGMFISTVLSAPILINCLMIVVNFLLHNCYMIRDIQVLKAKKMAKEANKKDKKKTN